MENPRPPQIYGKIKDHKPEAPARPIVSTLESPVYYLAQFCGTLLKPLTNNSTFNIKNSTELKDKLKCIKLKDNEILVSFDIISLFTNIPIEEAKTAIDERWSEVENGNEFPIKKEQFFEALDICLYDNNYFKYKQKFYKQKSGLAMGNPLSPPLADIVLEKLFKNKIMELDFQPTILYKYVDDVIISIPKTEIEKTKKIFESFHPNIKFTIEEETNRSLPYLDMTLIRTTENTIKTNWYCKKTSSNRLMNFHSSHPYNTKINVATSLIKRIMYLSEAEFRQKNIKLIHTILEKNNYPYKLIKRLISKILYTYNKPKTNNQATNQIWGSLPYIPRLTENIKKHIKGNSTNTLIANKIINNTASNFSKLKEKVPSTEKCGVVYSIPCECGKTYVGETGKTMKTRINQHKSDVKTALKPQNRENTHYKSALVKHTRESNHNFKFDEAAIVDLEKNRGKRWFKEACHIWKQDNTINYKTDSNRLKQNYGHLIKKYYNQNK